MRTSTRNLNTRRFAAGFFFVFVLCVLCNKNLAQGFKTVHPGVEYAQVTHKLGNDPVKINLLRLDLTKVRLDVHHAFDKAIGLEPTSQIAKRHGAVAAINAGFFRLDKTEFAGDAAGILVIDGQMLSESQNDRIAIRIRNLKRITEVWFQHLQTKTQVSTVSGDYLDVRVSGINRQRKAGDVIVYTPPFGDRTLTDSLGTEIVFQNCKVALACRIDVIEGGGNSLIPKDGFVLSVGPNGLDRVERLLRRLKERRDLSSTRSSIDSEVVGPHFTLTPEDDITNGVPLLLKNGELNITWQLEGAAKPFAEMRHPRTAVAKLNVGKFLMITVDGRQPGVSVGMTLQELAEYLLSLGATDAMNLDGGGSTTMFLDGRVVNTPSDKEGERKIGDAILVTLRPTTKSSKK